MTDSPIPLDDSLYSRLNEEDIKFLKSQTGISDDKELKKHILHVQAEIYAVHPYYCIRFFKFAKLEIVHFPAYKQLIKLGAERPGALYLELASCVGNDVRKAIADGFPVTQTLASDLHPEFWEYGHRLFKSTPETFLVQFIPGDVFNPAFLTTAPIPEAKPAGPPPALNNLTSLTPLNGHLSAIHASAFFHLFSEEKQLEVARLLAPLLSPEPGSIVFGGHLGATQYGVQEWKNSHGIHMFCHSPESWKEVWETKVFKPGQVRVDAFLVDLGMAANMVWSVTRL
ncbi:hypothetical protein EIP86_002691 [Pleurotus ostreatoroseus]|nr:hypothetical protein EIP86_002691 [Pleurotus ostreatoroseus]